MRLRLTTTLLLLLLSVSGVRANVWRLNGLLALDQTASKKPTPTPTPPCCGPVPSDPGGPGRSADKPVGTRKFGIMTGAIGGPAASIFYRKAAKRNRAVRVADRGYDGPIDVSVRTFKGCDPTQHEEENLTGTYSGQIEFPGRGLSGSATLTIEGKRFNLTTGNVVLSGNIASETTCNYTAVAMRFETASSLSTSTNLPETVSLRAKRFDSNLSLSPVGGEKQFEFMPVSNMTRRRRH